MANENNNQTETSGDYKESLIDVLYEKLELYETRVEQDVDRKLLYEVVYLLIEAKIISKEKTEEILTTIKNNNAKLHEEIRNENRQEPFNKKLSEVVDRMDKTLNERIQRIREQVGLVTSDTEQENDNGQTG